MPPDSNTCADYSGNNLPFLLRAFRDDPIHSFSKQRKKKKSLYGEEKELFYCITCLRLITSGDQRIQVAGSHEHSFLNPGGCMYEIGCFQDAIGSVAQGVPTDEFTWFKGFRWRVAYCNRCFQHIGWQYLKNNQECFWGLILRLLTTGYNGNPGIG